MYSLKVLSSGSSKDTHTYHSFPYDSAAEEHNAISLKFCDDPYLSRP